MLMTVCILDIIISYFSSSAKQFICFKLYSEKSPLENMVEKKFSVFYGFEINFFPSFSIVFPAFSSAAGAYPVLMETSPVTGANIGTCAHRVLVIVPSRREESILLR